MILINTKPEPLTNPVCPRVKPHKNETLYSWLARKRHQEKLFAWEKGRK